MIDQFIGKEKVYILTNYGLGQLKKIKKMNKKRHDNFFEYYNDKRNNWSLDVENYSVISNMAYPVIDVNIENISKLLTDNNVENRPLICGSIGKQPFWKKLYGETRLKNADFIDATGMYVPNNPDLSKKDIERIRNIIYGE